jgi:uncharacterized membrane protein (UPF0127 family)
MPQAKIYMKITNITKKKVLAGESRRCESITSKAIGLMFSRRNADFGLIFAFKREAKASLHMFFVFYPIDVIFLDKNLKIVEIKEDFRPFTTYHPKQKANYLIELPNGKASCCSIGDIISFK